MLEPLKHSLTSPEASSKNDVVKLTVTLTHGADFELAGGRKDAVDFHSRYKKFFRRPDPQD